MTFVNALAIINTEAEEKVYNYFRKSKALSSNSAIDIDFNSFNQKLGVPINKDDFTEFPFIKKTKAGKYYLDEALQKSKTLLAKKTLSFVIFGLGTIMIFLLILLYFISLMKK